MRSISALILMMGMVACYASCTSAQQPDKGLKFSKSGHKILIVYLSRTNNTKALAELIHDEIGGTIVPIELETPYPGNYRETVEQVGRENETGFLPPLKTKIENIDQYDVVFVGFPTWECIYRLR